MQVKTLILLFISFLVCIVIGIIIEQFFGPIEINVKPALKFLKPNEKKKHVSNYKFIINNNLAQYSSYITKIDNNYYIEAYVYYNFKYLKYDQLDKHICLVKLLDTNYYKENDEVIELLAVDTPPYYFDSNRKIKFVFKPSDFKSYNIDERNFDINNIVVAVIHVSDYDKNLSEEDFNKKIDWGDIYKYEKILFPYSLIRYQIPTILEPKEPILKTVSSCVHYTYSLPDTLKGWIDIHLKFGVGEIIFYDGTPENQLTNMINKDYPYDPIIVRPYRINLTEFCSDDVLVKSLYPKVNEIITKYCKNFWDLEFLDFFNGRSKHEQITVNDCYTYLSSKHEYITYYDFDEFVFPRTLNITQDPKLKCDDKNGLCSLTPFDFKSNTTSDFYNYVDGLVDKYRDNRNKSLLASISFQHAAYLIPDELEQQTIKNLGILLNNINDTTVFPIYLYMGDPTTIRHHKFIIEKNDTEYAKYIYESYNSLATCLYRNVNETKINKLYQRYLYFLTEDLQRWPKCILYYKNVRSLFIHYPMEILPGSWDFKPSQFDGHILPHFRTSVVELIDGNHNGTIRKLNIDYEYLFFWIKKFTNYC